MKPEKTIAAEAGGELNLSKVFTVEQANRALVYVRGIVQDIVKRFGTLTRLRHERDELLNTRGNDERIAAVSTEIETTFEALNHLNEELGEVGCVLKDWATGLIDFPATHEGRRVWLCWQLGEERITHWHEFHLGYAARQAIGSDF